jgi:hypothetical protein
VLLRDSGPCPSAAVAIHATDTLRGICQQWLCCDSTPSSVSSTMSRIFIYMKLVARHSLLRGQIVWNRAMELVCFRHIQLHLTQWCNIVNTHFTRYSRSLHDELLFVLPGVKPFPHASQLRKNWFDNDNDNNDDNESVADVDNNNNAEAVTRDAVLASSDNSHNAVFFSSDGGQLWNSRELLAALHRKTMYALIVVIAIQVWRHLAIAIDSFYLQGIGARAFGNPYDKTAGIDDGADEYNWHHWQAGHTLRIGNTFYGNSAVHGPNFTNIAQHNYLRIS